MTSLGGTGEFECYSGTLNTLPDGRILFTWCYGAIRAGLPAAQRAKARHPKGGKAGAGVPGAGEPQGCIVMLNLKGSRGSGGPTHGTPSHPAEDPLDPLHIGTVPWRTRPH